ncbi:HAD family hydrolase [Chondromyces apiculatus]|uniref:phosphoglycolate phosphatase n=1 Tax=Chondromyces apiculatus DSM 436 TaxID=1192034 RepID=A0A017T4G2_9BACT|nr:HAD-IA family hydrolase [Chondromyces apiculatus]EYF03461.1 HAD-superfamily hydrolase, subfamily IA, variant 3 [Chondromyces apiculatus DSM 436]
MRAYGTVLFDLDGTLIDSIRLILDSFHHTLAAFGMPPREEAELLRGIGTPLAKIMSTWAPDAATTEAMLAIYRAHNLEHHDRMIRAFPGIPEALDAFRAQGIRLGVVTSKSRRFAEMGLRATGLDAAFPVMICGDEVTHPKPHREPVDKALALLGVTPDDALFVGDSLHDLHAGRAAAVDTGAALWGPFTREDLVSGAPTHWLTTPDALRKVVQGERLSRTPGSE